MSVLHDTLPNVALFLLVVAYQHHRAISTAAGDASHVLILYSTAKIASFWEGPYSYPEIGHLEVANVMVILCNYALQH